MHVLAYGLLYETGCKEGGRALRLDAGNRRRRRVLSRYVRLSLLEAQPILSARPDGSLRPATRVHRRPQPSVIGRLSRLWIRWTSASTSPFPVVVDVTGVLS